MKISWKNLPTFLRYEFFKFFTQKNAFFESQKFCPREKSWAYAYRGSLYVDRVSDRSMKNSWVYGEKPSSSWAPMEPDIYAYRRKKTANGVGVIHSSTPYKLLQFQPSGPEILCFYVSVCLFLLSFVCFYFYIWHEWSCHNLIILPLPACSCALFICIALAAGSLKVAVVLFNLLLMHLTVNGCTHCMFVPQEATTVIGSGCP